jgi:hypothetical protein
MVQQQTHTGIAKWNEKKSAEKVCIVQMEEEGGEWHP